MSSNWSRSLGIIACVCGVLLMPASSVRLENSDEDFSQPLTSGVESLLHANAKPRYPRQMGQCTTCNRHDTITEEALDTLRQTLFDVGNPKLTVPQILVVENDV
eukprot:TRINITY_DN79326_c0_g1_i1.p1 TRINITY_DN79326_c0_g1~~TRINITY_DN79326_c0_g1_i1.p1  ORF type:complete len:104 (+),score=12.81 TRINITY_DN79326_c0_g1_i1:86-397(+)